MNETTSSNARARQIRFAPFALGLLCFVLPFVEVSCQGQKVLSLTGIQLTTGTELENKDPWTGQTKQQKVPPETTVALVLLCAAVATLTALIVGRLGMIIPALAGVAGLILMLVTKTRLDNQVLAEGHGLLAVNYGIGFIGTCIFLVIGVAVSALQCFAAPPQQATKPQTAAV